jgi:cytochrome c oxidase assembly factor CtaG
VSGLLHDGWLHDPGVLGGVALLAVAYAALLAHARRRGRAVSGRAVGCFAGAVLALLVALASPLATLAEGYLLTAHMAQHLLLILVVPPLALLGLPGWLLRAVVATSAGDRLARAAGRPLVAFLAGSAVLAGWHLPPLYDAALRDVRLHALEHLSFLAAAGLFWWPVVAPLPEHDRLGPLGRVFYLFGANVPAAAIAAPLTLAPGVLYAPYLAAADPLGLDPLLRDGWGLTPLADQRLAGVLMWGPMSFLLTAIALAILVLCFDAPVAPEPAVGPGDYRGEGGR